MIFLYKIHDSEAEFYPVRKYTGPHTEKLLGTKNTQSRI